jgi:hypothetical protein
MRIKTVLFITALFITALVGSARATCNSSYVQVNGSNIAVLPTGSDDTANLKCAFDLGIGRPGAVVQLAKGTYITDRIVVDGFMGTLRGAGMDATIIRNPDYPVYVTPDDCQLISPQSPDYACPYLFVLLGGDYTITDLTVSIVGEEPATDWSIFGIRDWLGHGLHAMGHFTILGSASAGYPEANATFARVKISGEITSDPIFGSNVNNAIIYQGFTTPDFLPVDGNFTVKDSVFEAVASANPAVNARDSRVSISGNIYRDVQFGAEFGDLTNTIYEFSHNQFSGVEAVHSLDNCIGAASNCGFDAASIVLKNNVIRGTFGIVVDGTFANGTTALVLGNNVTGVSDTGVLLGVTSNHCTVVGTGRGSAVDYGVNNSITGMIKGASPQGPRIKSFLQLLKEQ